MTVVTYVFVNGESQATGMVGAFVGDDVRGVAGAAVTPTEGTVFQGVYPFNLVIYGNTDGETISFELDLDGKHLLE